jgi:hypothetical protein
MRDEKLVRLLTSDPDTASGRARIFYADPLKQRRGLLKYETYYAGDPAFLAKWSETLMPNLGMLFDLQQAGGYEPMADRKSKQRATRLDNALISAAEPAKNQQEFAALLSASGVKYLVTYGRHALPASPSLVLVGQGREHVGLSPRIYRNTRFASRARIFQHRTLQHTPAEEIPDVDLSVSSNVVSLSRPSSSEARRLVLADSALPGWQAYVNGLRVPVAATAHGFRSIELPATDDGKADAVVFVYGPTSFTVAFFCTVCTLMVLSGWCCARINRIEKQPVAG